MLRNALLSLSKLQVPEEVRITLLLCDNEGSSRNKEVFDEISNQIEFKCLYFIEANRGLTHMRNLILREAINLKASHLALFDDDETVDKYWLVQLMLCQEKYKADAVTGKVVYIWPDGGDLHRTLKSKYARVSLPKTGALQDKSGTSNVLLKLDIVRKLNLTFHPDLNLKGGEDILFFNILFDHGAKIVWCNEALTYENVPRSRATVEWILQRKYRYGYTRYLIEKFRFGKSKALTRSIFYCFTEVLRCGFLLLAYRALSEESRITLKTDLQYLRGIKDAILGMEYLEYATIHGH